MKTPGPNHLQNHDVPTASLCGVVVTFHPEPSVAENLRAMVRECKRVIVVDNGSSDSELGYLRLVEGVEIVALGGNRGIAIALNVGFQRAREEQYDWVVSFDQDSLPEPRMVLELLNTARRLPGVVIVGPSIREAALAKDPRWLCRHPFAPFLFRCPGCGSADLEDVTVVISSGSLTSVDAWSAAGGFEDRLFIDYVDTDFCLRVRRNGGKIAASYRGRMSHHLGKRERRKILGRAFYPTHHGAFRHYYVARNRVLMIWRHALREPHWFAFECAATVMWTFRALAFEDHKWKKILGMMIGTRDGLCGRFGACPEHIRRFLQS